MSGNLISVYPSPGSKKDSYPNENLIFLGPKHPPKNEDLISPGNSSDSGCFVL